MKEGIFNPFALVDIDTILISSRHLFRAPYSLHEKTKLVSLPIPYDKLMDFKKEDANPSVMNTDLEYLNRDVKPGSASRLILQAYDSKKKKHMYLEGIEEVQEKKEFDIPKEAIKEEFFPPCIVNILKEGMEDGKKRALFILVNFLRSVGWSWDMVIDKINEWNKLNKEPLREVYINAQVAWHKKQNNSVLPPNCSNDSYYKDLRICCDEEFCRRYKNPVNFATRRSSAAKKYAKKKKVKKVKTAKGK